MTGIRIPVSQSLALRQEKHPLSPMIPRTRHGTIIGILYASRSFVVQVRAPAHIQAKADESLAYLFISKAVSIGDEVDIEQLPNHKWKAVKYYRVAVCAATPTDNTSTTTTFPPSIQPDNLFVPPFQTGGNITPLGQTPPPPVPQPGTGMTYDVGGGYAGTIPVSTIAQAIGLLSAAIWGHYFVQMTGSSDSWTIDLNGSTIASGSGSVAWTALGSPAPFGNGSGVVFTIVATGGSSDLYWGCGVLDAESIECQHVGIASRS